jgi:hypothetical protein
MTGSAVDLASDDTLVVALRNEAAEPLSDQGWLQLNIKCSPRHRAAQTREDDIGTRAHGEVRQGLFPQSEPAAAKPKTKAHLLGSFASGPQAIWREVPASGDRPAYYHSEVLGVSQWRRPNMPLPRPEVQQLATDLKLVSPGYTDLLPTEQSALLYGEMKPRAPREPTAAEEEEARAQAALSVLAAAESAEEEQEEGAKSPGRLPLLSAAASQHGTLGESGAITNSKLRAPAKSISGAAYRSARREEVAAEKGAERARKAKLEAGRRAQQTFENTLAAIEAKAVEAAVEAEAELQRQQELEQKQQELEQAKLKKAGGLSARPNLDSAAASKGDVTKPREGKPKPATYTQIERLIKSKCEALRADEEALYRMRKAIRDDRVEAMRQARSAPDYKPFLVLNQQLVSDHTPQKRAAHHLERHRRHQQMSAEAAARHAGLLSEESSRHLGWDASMSMPRSPRTPRTPSELQRERERAEEREKRGSTLSLGPGAMYSEDTSKGRARKLAAQLAKRR